MSAEEFEKLNLSIDMVSNVLRGKNDEMRIVVLNYLLMISGREGDDQLLHGSLVNDLLDVIELHNDEAGQLALKTLINVSGDEKGSQFVVDSAENNGSRILKLALDPRSILSDDASKILANLTRSHKLACELANKLLDGPGLRPLMEAVSDKAYNARGQRLEYLAHVVGNLSQSPIFRKKLLDPLEGHFERVLPVINASPSSVERFGIASAVYNCLFDSSTHETLTGPPFDVLPVLLLPLAGPEEFDPDEYDKMPVELQYLPDDKTREKDPSTRNLLLRALLHLCTTRKVRTDIRDRNAYLILREYHKWEKDRQNLLAVENVIDLLIRTEDEIGVEDLTSLTVPDDLTEKFEKMDKDFLEDS